MAAYYQWDRFPRYDDLDTIMGRTTQDLVCALDDHLVATTSLIDSAFELDHPEFSDYTDLLTEIFGHEHDELAERTTYRAVHFAVLAVAQVVQRPVLTPKHYFETVPQARDCTERIRDDSQRYLLERPVINGLVNRYMPELDHARIYEHLARAAAALTFMQLEAAEKYKFIDSQVASFRIGLAQWNGSPLREQQ